MILRYMTKKSVLSVFIATSLLLVIHLRMLKYIMETADDVALIFKASRGIPKNVDVKEIKSILSWNKYYLIRNEKPFLKYKCKVKNCLLTDDVNYFDNVTQFDAIMFFEPELESKFKPYNRTPNQIYIFSSVESAYNKPACELYNDNFFNWTFTYRLDSDIVWPYFTVRNLSGHQVAPTRTPDWTISPGPLDPTIKAILKTKTKAAAWIVSHCQADSLRDDFLSLVQEYLYEFDLQIDVFGDCSKKTCGNTNQCDDMLRRDYFFYMAFENSQSVDYVTEKVLHAYNSYTVPIVYGGADYNRFLPPGSYIDALKSDPYHLALKINDAMKNHTILEQYFYYTNQYTFDGKIKSDRNSFPIINHPFCDLCEALNDEVKTKPKPAIKDFRIWWNGLNGMKWCLAEGYWNETSLINTDINHLLINTYLN